MTAWKPAGIDCVRATVGVKPAHWPVTLPAIWSRLLLGWVNVIWLVKQQHWVVSHWLSIRYVPIQLGVEEIIPFMKIEKKIKSNQ
jgi:hypothetical protein